MRAEATRNWTAADRRVRLVVVELDGRRYGLPIDQVVEMLHMVAVTPLPHSAEWVAGVINLRGQTVPVIDLRTRFGLEFRPYGLDTPICIVTVFDRLVALVADAAVEVMELPVDALDDPDEIAGREHPISALARTDGRLIPVLVLERVCQGAETLALPFDDYDAA